MTSTSQRSDDIRAETRFRPEEFEPKWRAVWEAEHRGETQDQVPGKENYYSLVMFPYPSGDLHIGHWYNYTGYDAFSRFKRMQGYNVMQPFGFDAFGLPAENAAIKHNVQPRDWTLSNIENMRRQLKLLGANLDWSREVVTCLPDYYKWSEWLFLQFLKAGLAYRAKLVANWCPHCNTTLANEQVVNGRCERCETPVIRKEIEQWLYRITKYADELLNFDGLDWPEKTVTMQRNWIGRSEGAEIRFMAEFPPPSKASKAVTPATEEIPVFTTRPDTIYGVTFFVLAPEHPLVERITTSGRKRQVREYVERARNETEIERQSTERVKTGVFTGGYVTNPVNGEKVPVWVADYVLMNYGHGAVMGVPAHDQRDFEFARKYDLPIRQVVCPDGEQMTDPATWEAAHDALGVLVNSGAFDGTLATEAKTRIIAELERRGTGKGDVTYRLHDWGISRQRFWGAPIPIIYCPEHGTVPVPEDQLPVLLPDYVEFKPTGESPLRYVPEFYETTCPICGQPATRETDTMDTFICSAWYFLRYCDPHNTQEAWSQEKIRAWMPVDFYNGGAEHAVMHLLYARFFVKALRDMGHVPFDEPFTRMFHQGIVLGPNNEKMSKSRGNVIAPDKVVERYGADAVRCYLMFMGPFDQGGPWNNQGIEGVSRFIHRLWNVITFAETLPAGKRATKDGAPHPLTVLQHKTVKRATEQYANLRFNTALASLMELTNALIAARESGEAEAHPAVYHQAVEIALRLMAPLAPYVTEEAWHRLGYTTSIHDEKWPTFDETLTVDAIITVPVQVNGKLRATVDVPAGADDDTIRAAAEVQPKVQSAMEGKTIRKVIIVPGKLINFVVG